MNFVLIAVSLKVALEITKTAQHCVLPWFIRLYVSKSRLCTCVQLLLECTRVICKTNWVIKPLQKHPKVANLSALSPVFSACIIIPFLYSNSKISRNSSDRVLWNCAQQKAFIQRKRSVKHFTRRCPTGLKFDLELKPLWRHCHVTFILIAQNIIP